MRHVFECLLLFSGGGREGGNAMTLFLVRMYLVQSATFVFKIHSDVSQPSLPGSSVFSLSCRVLPHNFHVYFLFPPPMLFTCSAHLVLLLILTALIIFRRYINRALPSNFCRYIQIFSSAYCSQRPTSCVCSVMYVVT